MAQMNEKELLSQAVVTAALMDNSLRSHAIPAYLDSKEFESAGEAIKQLGQSLERHGLRDEAGLPVPDAVTSMSIEDMDAVTRQAHDVVREISNPEVLDELKSDGRMNQIAWVGRNEIALQRLGFHTPSRDEVLSLAGSAPGAQEADASDDLQVQILRARANRSGLESIAANSLGFLESVQLSDLEPTLERSRDPLDRLRLESIKDLRGSLQEAGYQVPEDGTIRPTPYEEQPARGTIEQLLAIRKSGDALVSQFADDSGKLVPLDLEDVGVNETLARSVLNSRHARLSESLEDYERIASQRDLTKDEQLVRAVTPMVGALEVGARIDREANLDTEDPYSVSYPYKLTRALKYNLRLMANNGSHELLNEAIEAHVKDPQTVSPAARELSNIGFDNLEDLSNALTRLSEFAQAGHRRSDEAIINRKLASQLGLEDDSRTVVPEEDLTAFSKLNDVLVSGGTYANLTQLAGSVAKDFSNQGEASLEGYYEQLKEDHNSRNDAILESIESGGQNSITVKVHRGPSKRIPLEMTASEYNKLAPEVQKSSRAFLAVAGSEHFQDYEGQKTVPNDSRARLYAHNRMLSHLTDKLVQEGKEVEDRFLKSAQVRGAKNYSAEQARQDYRINPPADTLRARLLKTHGYPVVAGSRDEAQAVRKIADKVHEDRNKSLEKITQDLTQGREKVTLRFDAEEIQQFAREATLSGSRKPVALQVARGHVYLTHPEQLANRVASTGGDLGSLAGLKPGTKLHPMIDIDEINKAGASKGQVAVEVVNQRIVKIGPDTRHRDLAFDLSESREATR